MLHRLAMVEELGMLTILAKGDPGSYRNDLIEDALRVAERTGVAVEFDFNGYPIWVAPGDTLESAITRFERIHKILERSRDKY